MNKFVVVAGACILIGISANVLNAAGPNPAAVQRVVDARVAHYKEIGKASKAIRDELGQSSPNLANVQANARGIEALARQIPKWFPAGSGPQPGVKTEALPAIWQQVPTFKQRSAQLASAAHQVAVAAASGNVAATQAAAGSLGGTCKACHDSFREKK